MDYTITEFFYEYADIFYAAEGDGFRGWSIDTCETMRQVYDGTNFYWQDKIARCCYSRTRYWGTSLVYSHRCAIHLEPILSDRHKEYLSRLKSFARSLPAVLEAEDRRRLSDLFDYQRVFCREADSSISTDNAGSSAWSAARKKRGIACAMSAVLESDPTRNDVAQRVLRILTDHQILPKEDIQKVSGAMAEALKSLPIDFSKDKKTR